MQLLRSSTCEAVSLEVNQNSHVVEIKIIILKDLNSFCKMETNKQNIASKNINKNHMSCFFKVACKCIYMYIYIFVSKSNSEFQIPWNITHTVYMLNSHIIWKFWLIQNIKKWKLLKNIANINVLLLKHESILRI